MLNSKPSTKWLPQKPSFGDHAMIRERILEFSQALVTREQILDCFNTLFPPSTHCSKEQNNDHLMITTYIVLENIPGMWVFTSG